MVLGGSVSRRRLQEEKKLIFFHPFFTFGCLPILINGKEHFKLRNRKSN
jgi:hypothetical protein